MSLFDRFTAGLETLGKKANQALDEGKLRVELVRVRRRMDNAARDLGYITYRQAKGTAAAPDAVEALTRRIDEGQAAAARIEAEIAQVRQRPSGPGPAAQEQPGPATADSDAAASAAASAASPGETPPGP